MGAKPSSRAWYRAMKVESSFERTSLPWSVREAVESVICDIMDIMLAVPILPISCGWVLMSV